MLTVWRRLHIEIDSLGDVGPTNNITGTITAVAQQNDPSCNTPQVPNPPPQDPPCYNTFTVYQVAIDGGGDLEFNRFENGRMVIGDRSFRVWINNGNVAALRGVPPLSARVQAGDSFTLYDDDNFDDGAGILNGDEGEDITPPPIEIIQPVDNPCLEAVSSNCNVFAPAFVKPVYDLTVGIEEVAFAANVNVSVNPLTQAPPPVEIHAHFEFDNFDYETSLDFWTVYIVGAYQYDIRVDSDPNSSPGVRGIVDALNGLGALIFMETTRATEISNPLNRPIGRNFTVAHELGHLFNGQHNDLFPIGTTDASSAGLMSTSISRVSGVFNPVTINKYEGSNEWSANSTPVILKHQLMEV